MSTNAFGSPDLDLRPPEMERSTMNMWVQRCPHCGYCAPSIEEKIDGADDRINSKEYKGLLNSSHYPELARDFLCCSMLLENAAEYAKAGQVALRAAWSCDDHQVLEAAIKCRLKAFDLLSMARDQGESIIEEGEEALFADILRRSGRFEEALNYCRKGIVYPARKILDPVLKFQIQLIIEQDTKCYTIADAVAFMEEVLFVDIGRRARRFEEEIERCKELLEKRPGKFIDHLLRFQLHLCMEHDKNEYTIADAMNYIDNQRK